MRRSVSARIFISFFVVMVAFSAVIGFTVHRMQQVRVRLDLISSGYLRLTLTLGELHTVQKSILETLADRAAGTEATSFVRRQVQLARQFRLSEVQSALQAIQQLQSLNATPNDKRFIQRAKQHLQTLLKSFQAHEHGFSRIFWQRNASGAEVRLVAKMLQPRERQLTETVRQMRDELRTRVQGAAVAVATAQRYGVWAGLILITLALIVSLLVTLWARKTLRPLKTLVAGTKRIGGGDLSQNVPVVSNDELGILAAEFNKMAEAIREREQRLLRSERLAAAGMLASHITHEVRNPLNSISLNTEMLEEELTEQTESRSDEAAALCKAIRREVDRLTEFTEDYLRFARLPKPSVNPENINVIVRSLVEFLGEEFRQKGIVCHTELTDPLPLAPVDDNQIRQALLNLLRNAADALSQQDMASTSNEAPPGQGTKRSGATPKRIQIQTGRRGDQIEIIVADTGPGINGVELDRIFEPFFSTKDGGTGLGLAITHRIISENGGSISVESSQGQGTLFRLLLPAIDERSKLRIPSKDVHRDERN